MNNVDISDIQDAYTKLKSHVYYDSSDLFLRRQLAIFETNLVDNDFDTNTNLFNFLAPYRMGATDPSLSYIDFPVENKFQILAEEIGKYSQDKPNGFFEFFFNRITYNILPKKIQPKDNLIKDCENFISNVRSADAYIVNRCLIQIDLPAELQIIAVLWIVKYGYKLEKHLTKNVYGNRLILSKEEKKTIHGSNLFFPYQKQYQKWRDNGIEEAKKQLDNNNTCVFINLDIRDYYYSVRLDFKKIEEAIPECKESNLHNIFKRIHFHFTNTLVEIKFPNKCIESLKNSETAILPIGLISSSLIANWHLKEFDDTIIEKIRPSYYGRYVDDILLLITNQKLPTKNINNSPKNKTQELNCATLTESYILSILKPVLKSTKTPPCYNKNEIDTERVFQINGKEDCIIQAEKTLIYYFDYKESSAVIDKLKKELIQRTSEFQSLPDSESDGMSFDNQAFHLIYDSTQGKFRTLKDYKENRYGLSTFLYQRIFSALRRDKQYDLIEGAKIMKLFKGINALDNFRLWEKLFVYFIVNNDKLNFVSLFINLFKEIEKIEFSSSSNTINNKSIINTLKNYLYICFEMAYALNPKFLNEKDSEYIKFKYFSSEKGIKKKLFFFADAEIIDSYYITRFRKSNLVRNHYITQPLLNYTKYGRSTENSLLVKNIFLKNYDTKEFSIDINSPSYNPRNIKFWECCIATMRSTLFEESFKVDTNSCSVSCDFINSKFILEKANNLYEKLNNNRFMPTSIQEVLYINKHKIDLNEIDINEIHIKSLNQIKSPLIAIVNTKLNDANFINSLRSRPNLNSIRFKDLIKILNHSHTEKANILIFPECCIPHDILPTVVSWAVSNQTMVVLGLEPWNVNNIVYNFIVTILPTEINSIKDAVITFRLKNFYSHDEESQVTGNGYKVPKPSPFIYEIFNWRGIYFSPYYCYEIANPIHRSIFRSKVDLIIASEWNQDVNYFSNIVESLSRDLHVYVAQVNNSVYGDSRLTQPAPTAVKDIVRLKGGDNSIVLVGKINIDELREFQRQDYILTKNNKNFKPLPPEFDRKFVLRRINNEIIFQKQTL